MKNKKIIAIIPARGDSKAIPKKNIINFCGKPLIAWSIEQALHSSYISEVFVSSDDDEILSISKKIGAKIIKRPKEIATDTSTSEEALLHAVNHIEKTNNKKIDMVVFFQATSPLRTSADIDSAIEFFVSKKADSLFSAARLDDFCIWEDIRGKLKSTTFDYKNRGRRQDRRPCYLENGSIYIFKPKIIKQYNNRLGGKMVFYEMPFWKSYEIDSEENIEICEYYMRSRILKGRRISAELKNIRLIVYDFDGVLTDNKVTLREDGLESVVVNRSDGLAIAMIKEMGIKQLILSKEKNRVVQARADKLGIALLQGIDNKKKALMDYCGRRNILLENVICIGNDINDLEVMQAVGYPVCPSDAAEEVKEVSKIILPIPGGAGVVKNLVEYF